MSTTADVPKPINWAAAKAETSRLDAPCKGHSIRGLRCMSRDCTNNPGEDPAVVAKRDGIDCTDLAGVVGRWAGYRSPECAFPEVGAVEAVEKMLNFFGVNPRYASDSGIDMTAMESGPVTLPDGTEDHGGWVDTNVFAGMIIDVVRAAGFAIIPVESLEALE